jgi:hypothetical protein
MVTGRLIFPAGSKFFVEKPTFSAGFETLEESDPL